MGRENLIGKERSLAGFAMQHKPVWLRLSYCTDAGERARIVAEHIDRSHRAETPSGEARRSFACWRELTLAILPESALPPDPHGLARQIAGAQPFLLAARWMLTPTAAPTCSAEAREVPCGTFTVT